MRRILLALACMLVTHTAYAQDAPPAYLTLYGPGNSVARLVPLSTADDDKKLATLPEADSLFADRKFVQAHADSVFGQEVTVVTLIVLNDSASMIPITVNDGFQFGIVRDGSFISTLVQCPDVTVNPGERGYTFLVFPKMIFQDNDRLVVKARSQHQRED